MIIYYQFIEDDKDDDDKDDDDDGDAEDEDDDEEDEDTEDDANLRGFDSLFQNSSEHQNSI